MAITDQFEFEFNELDQIAQVYDYAIQESQRFVDARKEMGRLVTHEELSGTLHVIHGFSLEDSHMIARATGLLPRKQE